MIFKLKTYRCSIDIQLSLSHFPRPSISSSAVQAIVKEGKKKKKKKQAEERLEKGQRMKFFTFFFYLGSSQSIGYDAVDNMTNC